MQKEHTINNLNSQIYKMENNDLIPVFPDHIKYDH